MKRLSLLFLLLVMGITIAVMVIAIPPQKAQAASATGPLPCDIYASGGTPCVAAHSTVRALFSAYNGNLYQVRRSSDNATLDVGVLSAGGYANSAAQDSFCAGTSCVITIIYDQTGRGNNLTQAPPGGFSGPAPGGYDNLAPADAAPITVNGHRAYGVYVAPGTGYRDNNTNGIATGDNPEGEYAVVDGTHYNGSCCFDYGNAETDSHDDGNGTMEAISFGNNTHSASGSGNGPWVMADLENGLFSGVNAGFNSGDQSTSSHFVTAMVKGGPNLWAIRAANAQSGDLTTMYSGPRPNVPGYNPMRKQGAIVLGIGGDNSNSAAGTFYEGVMTSGYPSDVTENAVQASIVAAGYGNGSNSFSTSFESGQPQPTWSNTVDGAGQPAGGSNGVGGICCGLSGPEMGTRNEVAHSGSAALMYSGMDNSSTTSYAYMQVFDFSGQNLTVGSNTTLTYWIYPQSSSGNTPGANWASGNNSSCVAIDLIFSDGTNLRDSSATDQNGNRIHPAYQCGHLTMDAWNQVIVNLASVDNGKTIQRLDVGYDQPANTGGYRGYIDDISIG